jgi:predicted adenine nucleotide alpha hydrolase (AANH) superfamily ATPase
MKRKEALHSYAETIDLKVIYQEGYDLEGFIRNVVFRESQRCAYCYHDRLRSTALVAKRGKFDCFTSTLLYSKFQKHEEIKSIGQAVGKAVGVRFYYHDFRDGWKQGIEESKRLGMYRQLYCGCIYSEKERYFKKSE